MRFNLYAHGDYADEAEEHAEDIQKASGVPSIVVQEFLETEPLYDVTITFDWDPETGNINPVSCDVGIGQLLQ